MSYPSLRPELRLSFLHFESKHSHRHLNGRGFGKFRSDHFERHNAAPCNRCCRCHSAVLVLWNDSIFQCRCRGLVGEEQGVRMDPFESWIAVGLTCWPNASLEIHFVQWLRSCCRFALTFMIMFLMLLTHFVRCLFVFLALLLYLSLSLNPIIQCVPQNGK